MSEQEQKKYRIKVEVIDGSGEELNSEYTDGIECAGFVILGINEDGCDTALHHVTSLDVAKAIAGSDSMMAASAIAKGLRDAVKYEAKHKAAGILSALGIGMEDA